MNEKFESTIYSNKRGENRVVAHLPIFDVVYTLDGEKEGSYVLYVVALDKEKAKEYALAFLNDEKAVITQVDEGDYALVSTDGMLPIQQAADEFIINKANEIYNNNK